MFERRLRMLLAVLGLSLAGLIGRLGQLQLVHGDHYRDLAAQSLRVTPTQLPFVRGSIRDRTGETLVSDEPCWNLTVDFSVIAADHEETPATQGTCSAIVAEVKRCKRARRYGYAGYLPDAADDGEIERAFRGEFETMWVELARFTAAGTLRSSGSPLAVEDLRDRAREIYDQVARIRHAVAARRGFDAPVVEETTAHALLTDLNAEQQIAAREVFSRYPWVHVEPASVRRFGPDTTPFAHLLGRVGRVDAQDVASDPEGDDPFRSYQADERVGISGVEFAAERTLRGRRGRLTTDRDGAVVEEIEAERGRDVTLTIHAPVQRRLYELLGDEIHGRPDSPGGAVVVLDVPTREVLALVSYPSYDPNRFDELYPTLRDDTDNLPLLFRAVANRYPPGSTIKPLVCLAGLMNGGITLDSREECTGYLLPEHHDRWRCWEVQGTSIRKAHGSIDVVEALTGSCNIFMYRLGERLGVANLCSTFDMFGIGRPSGLGLPEDERGINPTTHWLMTQKNMSATPGTARLFAIGQGELAMTPVQVANLMATYASGNFRPVTLVKDGRTTPEWTLPARPEHWLAIRRGIYGVVNDPNGTAHKYAYFQHDRYALCGKTGSATAYPWPTSYRIPYTEQVPCVAVDSDLFPSFNAPSSVASTAVVREGGMQAAIERFRREHPDARFDPAEVEVATRWPPRPNPAGDEYSHAWFAGFLQPLDGGGRPDWSRTPRIAFAVLVEFGGSGGQTSGPLAKRIVAELFEALGPDLDDHVALRASEQQ